MATPKKPALGKGLNDIMANKGEGLGALLKGGAPANHISDNVNLSLIDVNPYQPRTEFDEEALN